MDILKLKYYNKYMKALELYAKGNRLKITKKDTSEYGWYTPARRRITFDDDLSESCTIAVILHELGHAMQHDIIQYAPNSRLERAYRNYYGDKRVTQNQLKLIVECEKEAWDNGRIIAKQLKIRLGKWFDFHAKYFLDSYRYNK